MEGEAKRLPEETRSVLFMQKCMKVLRRSLTHHGFTYKEGENVDILPFNPSGSCREGGLYFTIEKYISLYFSMGDLVADVTLPANAKVYDDPTGNKWKADRIIISNIRTIAEYLNNKDEESLIDMIKNDTSIFYHITKKTQRMCNIAIERNPYIFDDVPAEFQTLDMCIRCLKSAPHMFKFVAKQTDFICDMAVSICGITIAHIQAEFLTAARCLRAVKQNGLALKFIPTDYRTYEVCLSAIINYPEALEYVPDEHKTESLCMVAIRVKGYTLQFVPHNKQTLEMCLTAVKDNGRAVKFVAPEYIEFNVCLAAVEQYGWAVSFLQIKGKSWADIIYRIAEKKKGRL